MRKMSLLFATTLSLVGCATSEDSFDGDDDLIAPGGGGKADTGYYSNLAIEMDSTFASAMTLDLSGMSATDAAAYEADLRASPTKVAYLIDDQIKLAKNQLEKQKVHLNLSKNDLAVREIVRSGTSLRISYSVTVESLANLDELRAEGITSANLVNKMFDVRLAADPRNLYPRAGESCSTDFEDGRLDPGDVNEVSYFYYFDPSKPGCTVPLSAGTMTVKALLPPAMSYPEYDRLAADGKLDVAVFFGPGGHETDHTLAPDDLSIPQWLSFDGRLFQYGFRKVETTGDAERWVKTVSSPLAPSGELVETVDVHPPTEIAALGAEGANTLFRDALSSHEILVYDGHSFYGSLDVLSDKAAYPANTYQVVFMNSCWSYEYYTKQVLAAKATTSDPTGWRDADVINNTQTGQFNNQAAMTNIVLANLFAGVESGGATADGRRFTWQAIIGKMNDEAIKRKVENGTADHEIYGASGVRTNAFKPVR